MREHFLLDTGPLQEFFVLRYQAESNRRWPDQTFQFHALLTPLDQEDFRRFVEANRGHLGTSSGVVMEMHRFLRGAEDRCHSQQAQQDPRLEPICVEAVRCGSRRRGVTTADDGQPAARPAIASSVFSTCCAWSR